MQDECFGAKHFTLAPSIVKMPQAIWVRAFVQLPPDPIACRASEHLISRRFRADTQSVRSDGRPLRL